MFVLNDCTIKVVELRGAVDSFIDGGSDGAIESLLSHLQSARANLADEQRRGISGRGRTEGEGEERDRNRQGALYERGSAKAAAAAAAAVALGVVTPQKEGVTVEHFSGGSGQEERVLRTLHEQLTPEAHPVTPLKAPSPFDESTIFPQEENGSDIDDMSGHGGAGGGVSDDNAKSDGGRSTTQRKTAFATSAAASACHHASTSVEPRDIIALPIVPNILEYTISATSTLGSSDISSRSNDSRIKPIDANFSNAAAVGNGDSADAVVAAATKGLDIKQSSIGSSSEDIKSSASTVVFSPEGVQLEETTVTRSSNNATVYKSCSSHASLLDDGDDDNDDVPQRIASGMAMAPASVSVPKIATATVAVLTATAATPFSASGAAGLAASEAPLCEGHELRKRLEREVLVLTAELQQRRSHDDGVSRMVAALRARVADYEAALVATRERLAAENTRGERDREHLTAVLAAARQWDMTTLLLPVVSPDAFCTSENEETEEEEFEHKDMDDKDAAVGNRDASVEAVDESSAAEANREAVTPAAPLLSSSARDFASSSVHASSSRSISSSMVSTASTVSRNTFTTKARWHKKRLDSGTGNHGRAVTGTFSELLPDAATTQRQFTADMQEEAASNNAAAAISAEGSHSPNGSPTPRYFTEAWSKNQETKLVVASLQNSSTQTTTKSTALKMLAKQQQWQSGSSLMATQLDDKQWTPPQPSWVTTNRLPSVGAVPVALVSAALQAQAAELRTFMETERDEG